ncbi:DUF4292 domain-containing protein [Pedobacter jamesrossensis]|uniref:DUF4292 domain-containing protein n=1 Tax=Pedobacter jamesrossensis TaxID=1908238 RepID=UPI003622F5CA
MGKYYRISGLAEVARALITPDSIKIQNKLKSEYLKKLLATFIISQTNKLTLIPFSQF